MSIARYFNPKLRPKILANAEPQWLKDHPRRSYSFATVISVPTWCPRWRIDLLHAWAKMKSELTGVEHVLDHEVPLCHPYVSGLTVPWNLRIITRKQNAAKSNRFMPDQLELI